MMSETKFFLVILRLDAAFSHTFGDVDRVRVQPAFADKRLVACSGRHQVPDPTSRGFKGITGCQGTMMLQGDAVAFGERIFRNGTSQMFFQTFNQYRIRWKLAGIC